MIRHWQLSHFWVKPLLIRESIKTMEGQAQHIEKFPFHGEVYRAKLSEKDSKAHIESFRSPLQVCGFRHPSVGETTQVLVLLNTFDVITWNLHLEVTPRCIINISKNDDFCFQSFTFRLCAASFANSLYRSILSRDAVGRYTRRSSAYAFMFNLWISSLQLYYFLDIFFKKSSKKKGELLPESHRVKIWLH